MDAPDPSTHDPICEEVLIAIRRITRAIDLHSRLLLERYGLTSPQLIVLKTLGSLDEVSVGDLARRVHLSQATATGVLDRLEKRGLVSRRRGETDRRRMFVTTTPAARKLLQSAPSLLQDQFLREFNKLADWEQTLILSSLQRVVAMMEADSLDVTPMLASGAINTPT